MPLPFNRLQMVSKHAPVWSVWEVSEVLHCVLIAEPLELCSGRRSNLSAQQKYFPVLNKFRQFIIVIRMLSSRPKRVMWQSYCAEDTQRTSQTHTNRDTHIHTHTSAAHKLQTTWKYTSNWLESKIKSKSSQKCQKPQQQQRKKRERMSRGGGKGEER